MSDDIKPEVIKRTQDVLSKHIKKPQLTEKLLKKPPFRFLHDIVTNVIKDTGFLQGLFTGEELNHENIKDRDGKIAFLDKLINCVKLATGSALTVKSSKIVAGLEPTRTNELLQAIGQALDKGLDSKQAVQEVLTKSSKKAGVSDTKKKPGETSSTSKQETSKRKDPSTSSDAKKSDKKDPSSSVKGSDRGKKERQEGAGDAKKRSSSNQRTVKEKDAAKPSTKPGRVSKEEPAEKVSSKTKETKTKEELVTKVDEPAPDVKEKLVRKGSGEEKKGTAEVEPAHEENAGTILPDLPVKPTVPQEQNLNEGGTNDVPSVETVKEPVERQRPISALGRRRSAAVKQQRSSEEKAENESAAPAPPKNNETNNVNASPVTPAPVPVIPPTPLSSARPPSAVAGPSRAGTSSDNQASTAAPIPLVRPRTAARQGSARPGAPRLRNRGEVALVSEEQVKPAPVNLIVEAEGVKEDQDEDENLVVLENTTTEPVSAILRPDSETVRPSSQQGHLVAQILETQKELETGSKVTGGVAAQADNSGHKVEIDWEASRQRERGSALREVQRMSESIQTVTRAAHPIGKLLDSLQEDVESMQQELEHWQNMQRSLEEQLLAEEALTVQSTQPLKEHLQQLQQAVQAQQGQLSISKANILMNDQRIHKLLAGGDSTQQAIFTR